MNERRDTPLDTETVVAVQRRRWEFLRFAYEKQLHGSGSHRRCLISEAASAIGITDQAEIGRIVRYLAEDGLVRGTSGNAIAITNQGMKAVEQALTDQDRASQYFAPINVIYFSGGMHGSQIVQGENNAQSMQVKDSDWNGLLELLPELRAAVSALPTEARATASADLGAIEAQLSAPSPRVSVVKELLLSFRNISEQALGGVIGDQLTVWLRLHGWL